MMLLRCPHHLDRLLAIHVSRRLMLAAMVLMSAIACQGCGGEDWHAETYPAHGRITINGQPPAGAVIELHATGHRPDERNSRPWAVVQEDGTYVLSTYETGDGAPAGQYALTLRWSPDVTQPSLVDRLSGAYANPERSPYSVTISEGDNELPPVEITGARVLAKEAGAATGRPAGPPLGH